MDIQEKETLIAEIERFKEEALKMHIVQVLAHTYTITNIFDYSIDSDGSVIWYKAQACQLWDFWQAAKAQAVQEGFVLIKADNVNSFYQDDNEPENFCNSCDDLDTLGDLIDRDEIMTVNKHTSAHISTEKFYGAWGVIETSYGTAWKFKLFNTEDEAKAAMIEAQEPAND